MDGNEVFHLYHPNGTAPQTLLDTGAVSLMVSEGFPYAVHVLNGWQQSPQPANKTLLVTAATGETFQIVEQSKLPEEDLQTWFTRTAQSEAVLEPFLTKQGYVGGWTEDHLTAYVQFSPEQVLIFTYNLGRARRIEYRQTFEMFINSLAALPEPPASP